ncbi:MAG: DNA primase DnaG [Nanoarchaeota archaeon]
MGKISQVSSKYIIHAAIEIEGFVDRPDIIGAIFGQTEGLLGADLELRELQRSGRIGRIEVNVDTKSGKSSGSIILPSSLDKAETSIIAASLEIIQRIGPCNAKIRVQKIEDVRISKRTYVIDRAKELLKLMMETTAPDSQELADEVATSVRVMEITEYGRDRLPAGPGLDESDEVIVVEGRADVLNLLKHGFKNCIAMNGTSCPQTIRDLCGKKEITLFVDGDRGGDLIIRELMSVAEIDFVTKAPDGKEVEEITKKEIHKALRSKIAAEQVKLEFGEPKNALRRKTMLEGPAQGPGPSHDRPERQDRPERPMRGPPQLGARPEPRGEPRGAPRSEAPRLSPEERKRFGVILEGLIGTRGAFILDNKMEVMGKVPTSELPKTVKSLQEGVYAVVLDGVIDSDLVEAAEGSRVQHIVGTDSKVNPAQARVDIVTADML